MQLTLPSIQLKNAGRLFRAYVKLLGEKAAYRVEESLKVDLQLTDALDISEIQTKNLKRRLIT